jgi:hypothetical protein
MNSHTTTTESQSEDPDAAEQRYFQDAYEACRDYMTYHVRPPTSALSSLPLVSSATFCADVTLLSSAVS